MSEKTKAGDAELAGMLHMVQARLESGPVSAAEWEAIRAALRKGSAYAAKRGRDLVVAEAAERDAAEAGIVG